MTNPAFQLIGLTDLRNDPRYRNIDGQVDSGPVLVIAVLDTGIDGANPALDDNFFGYIDFLDDRTGQAISADQAVVFTDANASIDFAGHGTHVAGTIGAELEDIGVAPKVKLLGLNVIGPPYDNVSNSAVQDSIFNGLRWVANNRQGTINDIDYRIVGVNMSLGFYGQITNLDRAEGPLRGIFTNKNQVLQRSANSPERKANTLIQQLEALGIAVVSAAGNDYTSQAILRQFGQQLPSGGAIPQQNISTPAISSTIAAGSLDAGNGIISSFSQRLNNNNSPNMLFAPGGNINSLTILGDDRPIKSGTSMASPHITGAIALLQDAALTFGNRVLSPQEIQQILLQTADIINDGDNENYPSVQVSTPNGIINVNVPSTGEDFLRLNIYNAVQEVERRLSGSDSPSDTNLIPDFAPLDANGILAGAISLEDDLAISLAQLTTLTVVASNAIGVDAQQNVGNNDVDLFSFEVPNLGGLVIIETGANDLATSADTVLRLFDANGQEIAVDDNGAGVGTFSRIEAILEPGLYYAGVSGFGNFDYNPNVALSGSLGDTGNYSLFLQYQEAQENLNNSGADLNGTIAEAFSSERLVFDELETQIVNSSIGSDPISGVSDRVAVGRTDVDMFRIDLTTGGLIVLETSINDPQQPLDSIIRLFDASGTQLEQDDNSGEGLSSRMEVSLEVGTYFVGISGYDNSDYNPTNLDSRNGGTTGTTTLTLDFQPAGNIDPDGISNGATNIDLLPGETNSFLGEIGTDFGDLQVNEADVDLLEFVASSDGTILFNIDTPFGSEFANGTDELTFADTIIRFFDENGNPLDLSDDDLAKDLGGNPREFDPVANIPENFPDTYFDVTTDSFGNKVGHDTDSFLSVEVEKNQKYFVGVSGFGNKNYNINNFEQRNANSTGGFYQLFATYITTADVDGTIAQAIPSSLPLQVSGNVGFDEQKDIGSSDVDFYRITTNQRGLLEIEIEAFEGNTNFSTPVDSSVFLFDLQGNELAFNDDSTSSFDSRLEYFVEANTDYLIAVTGYGNFNFEPTVAGSGSGGDTGEYSLQANLRIPQTSPNFENALLVGAFNNYFSADANSFDTELDLDREIFGQFFEQLDTSSINSLPLGIAVKSVLGQDPQGSDEFYSAFSDLYREQSNLVFADSSPQINPISGSDDADYFFLDITQPGRYDLITLVESTKLGSLGTQTNLQVFDGNLNSVVIESGLPTEGVYSRNIVNFTEAGGYWLVVLPNGSASDNFDFPSHSFGNLTEEQLLEFASSLGEYGVLVDRFSLKATNTPSIIDGTFTVRFNDALDLEKLQLYDGADSEILNSPSIQVLDSQGNSVKGSLLIANSTTEVIFIPTNPLSSDSYTLTYNGDDFRSRDNTFENQRNLDGDGDGTPGGNLTSNLTQLDSNNLVITLPSFARGPGQPVNFRGPGLPISVSDAAGFSDVRLRLEYNPQLLEISDAQLASGLPNDWQTTGLSIDQENGIVVVDLAGVTPLLANTNELIRLTANIASTATLNEAQVLKVSGGAIDSNNNPITINSSSAIHQVSFLGDVDGNGAIDRQDAFQVLLIDSGVTDGFDTFDLIDPSLLGNLNQDDSGIVGTLDAFEMLAANSDTPLDTIVNPLDTENLPQSTVTISSVAATPGQQNVQVEVRLNQIDAAAVGQTLVGARIVIEYDTNLLDITDASGFPPDSPDVDFSSIFPLASENAIDANGRIQISATGGQLLLAQDTDVVLGTITFDVANNAPIGDINLTLTNESRLNDGTLTVNSCNGQISISSVNQAPTGVENDVADSTSLNNPLFRFQNTLVPGTYLFAAQEENQRIRDNFIPPFEEEGLAFNVSLEEADGLIQFNRFQNALVPGAYLFATEAESQSIRQNFPNFIEEGIAFYTYGADAEMGTDYYRFQNTEQPGTYLFVNQEERDIILDSFPQFSFEGIAFEAG